jgi:hypothetical protein
MANRNSTTGENATNAEDWQRRLINAAEARYSEAVRKRTTMREPWRHAIQLLKESTKRIYVRHNNGTGRGIVEGLPDLNAKVLQILTNIVHGDEDELLPQHIGQVALHISEDPKVANVTYRSPVTAMLKVLWQEYQGPRENLQSKATLIARSQQYTDDAMIVYGQRASETYHGWMSMSKTLVKNKWVFEENKTGEANRKYFSLTQ